MAAPEGSSSGNGEERCPGLGRVSEAVIGRKRNIP